VDLDVHDDVVPVIAGSRDPPAGLFAPVGGTTVNVLVTLVSELSFGAGLLGKLNCIAGYVRTAVFPAGWVELMTKSTVPLLLRQPYADSGPQWFPAQFHWLS